MVRRKPPDERRSDLIEAAMKVFGQKGYARATISEIVKEAGVAQGTFYVYFESKEDILDAVAGHVLQDIVDITSEISRSDKTAVEKVQEMIRAWMEIGISPGPLIEEMHDPRHAPLHDQMARKSLDKLLPPLTEIIRQGVAEGSIDVPYPEVTAVNWVSSNFPTESMPGSIDLSFDQMMDAYTDFVRRLLGLKDPKIFDGLIAESRSIRSTARKRSN